MALSQTRRATCVACALAARFAACCLAAAAVLARADDTGSSLDGSPAPLAAPPADREEDVANEASKFLNRDAAQFDDWEPLVEHDSPFDEPAAVDQAPSDQILVDEKHDLRPFDWMRHWGFHHSSTEGRFTEKGLAMERSSWLNRPYHFDWFVGPLLSDGPVDGRVSQGNDIFGGIRIGWDFDYYWGAEWRFGWSDPTLLATSLNGNDVIETEFRGSYMVSDVDFIYYPWGDTKVRPYVQWGLGLTQIGSVRPDGGGQEATLMSMPMGLGVRFPMTHWLAWRLEIIDNLAFGADGLDTMNNFAFTAGMELRLGARPNSYWPWRSSRTIW